MTSRAPKTRADYIGPERRRPQVLDTALAIIDEHGIAAVTMTAIAERLGVTRPVVYECFAGRGDVLAALLARETKALLDGALGALPPPRRGSVEQMFIDGFAIMLAQVTRRRASWRLAVGAEADPVLADATKRGRALLADQVSVVMRPLLEHWGVQNIDQSLPVLVEVFIAICETSVRIILDPVQDWTPDALAELVGRAAYQALRSQALARK